MEHRIGKKFNLFKRKIVPAYFVSSLSTQMLWFLKTMAYRHGKIFMHKGKTWGMD